jgi:hypothetical protein
MFCIQISERPKRQRKLPARMQNQDFEYGFGPAMAAELEATKPEEEKPATGPKKRGPPKRKLTAAAARKAAKTAENEQVRFFYSELCTYALSSFFTTHSPTPQIGTMAAHLLIAHFQTLHSSPVNCEFLFITN